MNSPSNYKRKIFNDPIYGFISIPSKLIFDLIEHRYFQRLRRIKQLGTTHLVYPGALHTRFHHALGAMHLMMTALDILRKEDVEISEHEYESACVAILLHDLGHGPYSHSLEFALIKEIQHEEISLAMMNQLNKEFEGQLDTAIAIFKGDYQKRFLHQLVSSQLDVDRLDYLKRDSFYTGVTEGVIGSERILSMLRVHNEELVIQSKGIYSIEKFLIARRLMYWQVYLHKTVVAAEKLLVNILKRAKELAAEGHQLFASPALSYFLRVASVDIFDLSKLEFIEKFNLLDDNDVYLSIKVWTDHSDPVLSQLSKNFVERHLYKIKISKEPFNAVEIEEQFGNMENSKLVSPEHKAYYVFTGKLENNAYNPEIGKITMLDKHNNIMDVSDAADLMNISVLTEPVQKYFLCYTS